MFLESQGVQRGGGTAIRAWKVLSRALDDGYLFALLFYLGDATRERVVCFSVRALLYFHVDSLKSSQ